MYILSFVQEKRKLWKNILSDIKRYTAKCFHDLLLSEHTNYESRKIWLLQLFQDKDSKKFQLWQHGNHPIELGVMKCFIRDWIIFHPNP
ncbi:MAG: hypothetical protein H7282_07745 [Cytophagaceae bacterium]|nr:hypothetical protein [Cytophagaceae bacterium]